MNSGDLKTYKCVKISKSNFFTITILFLHSICSESKKEERKKKSRFYLMWRDSQHKKLLYVHNIIKITFYLRWNIIINNYFFHKEKKIKRRFFSHIKSVLRTSFLANMNIKKCVEFCIILAYNLASANCIPCVF